MDELMQIDTIVRSATFSYSDEHELQAGIAEALTEGGIKFRREVRLTSRDRIDFMAGSIGIEIKVASSAETVLRQLQRYAKTSFVSQLMLITTRATHLYLPRTINHKFLETVFMSGVR